MTFSYRVSQISRFFGTPCTFSTLKIFSLNPHNKTKHLGPKIGTTMLKSLIFMGHPLQKDFSNEICEAPKIDS